MSDYKRNKNMTDREKIVDELLEVLYEAIGNTKLKRYRGDSHKTRQGYYNSLATLLNSFARLSKDLEIDELEERLAKLEEKFKDD